VKCPHCEREYTEPEDQRSCPLCGESLESENQRPEIDVDNVHAADQSDQGAAPSRQEYCPWEDQENLGFMESMVQTVKQSIFQPKPFFSKLPRRGGLLPPLLYGISLQMLGSMVGFLWAAVFGNSLSQLLAMLGGSAVALGLLIPLSIFMSIVVWSLALHASLFLVGGAHEDFEATFRIVCYTSGVSIFMVIPIFGEIVRTVWQLYITVIALREVQGITTAKAVGAIFIPFVFCCALPVAGLVAVLVATH
jgi:hypothetical protein